MKFAVMGAGAVGCYYGGMLARAGHEVVLIARPKHVQAITEHGLLMDTQTFSEYVRLQATSDVASVRTAQCVLLCVKSTDVFVGNVGNLLKEQMFDLRLRQTFQ